MRRVALLVLVMLASAPAARAESLAPDVAAKLPMPTTIMCATDANDWAAVLAHYSAPAGTGGITDRTSRVIHLPPATCEKLRAPFALASTASYQTLFHEFVHAALRTSDESVAECVSLFMYRYWLRKSFAASESDAQEAYALAWNDHLLLPPNYRGACVFEKRDGVSPLNRP